jgi:hypothetical protein
MHAKVRRQHEQGYDVIIGTAAGEVLWMRLAAA